MNDAPIPTGRAQHAKLLYVVSEDWYFVSHRLPMARAARNAGFEVHVATNVNEKGAAIQAEQFRLHHVPFARGTLSPFAAWRTISALRAVHRTVRPDIVHRVSPQPVVLGALAAVGQSGVSINALTGLGFSFTSKQLKARLARTAVRIVLKGLISGPRATILVQNQDDRETLVQLGVRADRITMIRGSGVDIDRLQPLPEPASPITIAFVGRLLKYKGIGTLVAAHRILRARGRAPQLLVAGTPDPASPDSITTQEMDTWAREPGIACLGHVRNIVDVWSRAHVAVLPSQREGVPLSLLEAAAFGRPMIATDAPGCREVVIPGRTGSLVPFGDESALADAIADLIDSPDKRARYGSAARQLAVEEFSATAVGTQIVNLYRSRLGM